MTLPLLHAAQTVAMAPSVDGRVATAAAGMLALALAAIWRPLPGLRRRRWRRRTVGAITASMMFLALLPAVLPYDHLFHHEPENTAASEQGGDSHALHCHESPGSCADAPLASGPGQFLTGDPLIVVPAMMAVLILVLLPSLLGISRRPETPPPMGRLTFS